MSRSRDQKRRVQAWVALLHGVLSCDEIGCCCWWWWCGRSVEVESARWLVDWMVAAVRCGTHCVVACRCHSAPSSGASLTEHRAALSSSRYRLVSSQTSPPSGCILDRLLKAQLFRRRTFETTFSAWWKRTGPENAVSFQLRTRLLNTVVDDCTSQCSISCISLNSLMTHGIKQYKTIALVYLEKLYVIFIHYSLTHSQSLIHSVIHSLNNKGPTSLWRAAWQYAT